jgi:hypothetical protein
VATSLSNICPYDWLRKRIATLSVEIANLAVEYGQLETLKKIVAAGYSITIPFGKLFSMVDPRIWEYCFNNNIWDCKILFKHYSVDLPFFDETNIERLPKLLDLVSEIYLRVENFSGSLLKKVFLPEDVFELTADPDYRMIDRWQAQKLAMILKDIRVFLYSSLPKEKVRQCKIEPIEDLNNSLNNYISRFEDKPAIAVLPHGPRTIPRYQ